MFTFCWENSFLIGQSKIIFFSSNWFWGVEVKVNKIWLKKDLVIHEILVVRIPRMSYKIYPDPTTNSETTNPNFHEFFDQLEKELLGLFICYCFVFLLYKKMWKFRIFSFRIGCWIRWVWCNNPRKLTHS